MRIPAVFLTVACAASGLCATYDWPHARSFPWFETMFNRYELTAVDFSTIESGMDHSLGLSGGTVYSWALDNGQNQLGRTGAAPTPLAVTQWLDSDGISAFPTPTVVQIAAGDSFCLARSSAGDVFWWGTLAGSTSARPRRLPLPDGGVGTGIAAGGGHSLISGNASGIHRLYAIGANSNGQCGQPLGTSVVMTPTQVPTVALAAAPMSLAAGKAHSIVVLANGSALGFGDNASGQLGNGTTLDTFAATSVVDIAGVPITDGEMASAGFNHSLILRADGMASFGDGTYGQIGRTGDPTRAVLVSGTESIDRISAGYLFNLATDSSGTLYSWGFLIKRQKAYEVRTKPMVHPGFSGILAIEAGNRVRSTTPRWTKHENSGGENCVSATGITPLITWRELRDSTGRESARLEGGESGTLRITLDVPAGPGGFPLEVVAEDGRVTFASQFVTVPEGALSVDVPFTTMPVWPTQNVRYEIRQENWTDPRALVLRSVNAGKVRFRNASMPNLHVMKGGHTGFLVATLNYPAPVGGVSMPFTSSRPDLVPSGTIFVEEGETVGEFMFSCAPVLSKQPVKIEIDNDRHNVATTFTVTPPDLKRLRLSQPEVIGGSTVELTIELDGTAPSAGMEVALTSSHPALASVPASFLVKPGLNKITVPTSAVASRTSVVFRATFAGVQREARVILKR